MSNNICHQLGKGHSEFVRVLFVRCILSCCIHTMPAYFKNGEKCNGRKFELAFTRCRNNLKTVRNLTVRNSLQDFDAIEKYLHPNCRSVLFQKRRKLFYFHRFQVFTRCRFQNVPVSIHFSKFTVFKMCRHRVNAV